MRGGRFGKYGEFKKFERLRESRSAKLSALSIKDRVRQAKKPSMIKKGNVELRKKHNVKPKMKEEIKCDKCGSKMEFYGVDGSGGKKFSCTSCYEKIVVRSE